LKGAIDDFNQAIQINPNIALAYINRGNARSQLENVKEAMEDYNQALRLNPNLAQGYLNRGLTRRESGDEKGATADLQRASELFQQQGKIAEYQSTLNLLREINNK
jgi:tetratricopeptide (TPR) repeat protein